MLIAGGAIAAAGFAAMAYYGVQFISDISSTGRHTVEPQGTYELEQGIEAGTGTYIVSLPDYGGGPVMISVQVRDPAGTALVDKQVDAPFFAESFTAPVTGNYTLAVSNTSPDPIVLSVTMGNEEDVSQFVGTSLAPAAISLLLLAAGIIIIIAGVAVTILDGRREKKMRQFGDMSDLR